MALTSSCPKCQKALSIREDFIGKMMRCPYCQGTFVAGASASPTVPPSVPAGENLFAFSSAPGSPELGELPTVPAPGGPPVHFDWESAQVAPGEVLGARPAGSKGGIHEAPVASLGVDMAWQNVSFGLLAIIASVFVFLAAAAYLSLMSLVVGVGAKGAFARLLTSGALIVIPAGFLALLASLTGVWVCTLVPTHSRLKPLAVASASCVSVAVPILIIAFASTQQRGTSLYSMASNCFGLTGLGLLAAGGVLWILFMRGVAVFFGVSIIAENLKRFVLFAAGIPIGLMFVGMITRPESDEGQAFIQLIAMIVSIVFFLWFLNLIRDLRKTVDAALQKARLEQGQATAPAAYGQ